MLSLRTVEDSDNTLHAEGVVAKSVEDIHDVPLDPRLSLSSSRPNDVTLAEHSSLKIPSKDLTEKDDPNAPIYVSAHVSSFLFRT